MIILILFHKIYRFLIKKPLEPGDFALTTAYRNGEWVDRCEVIYLFTEQSEIYRRYHWYLDIDCARVTFEELVEFDYERYWKEKIRTWRLHKSI